jgi:predicted Zn-dependent protease
MRVNRVDEAAAEYEKVVSDNPNERGARTTLADIYEHQGRWADAERMLTELERLAPGELSPLRRLEAFYRRSGQVEKATQTEARVRNLVSPPRSLRPLRPSVR